MKGGLFLYLLLTLLSACTKDNACSSWYTGENCKTERRFELTGIYSGDEVQSGGYKQYKNIDVQLLGNDLQTITIDGKVAKLLNEKGDFEIPLTEGANGSGYSYEGQGHFNGYWLIYGYNIYLNDSLITVTNFQGTK